MGNQQLFLVFLDLAQLTLQQEKDWEVCGTQHLSSSKTVCKPILL